MEKKLKNLKWRPRWASHMGCVKGCLDYLGLDVSDAWLYGATGHAFIINIMDGGPCPSGPTAWNYSMLQTLGRNIGYNTDGVIALKSHGDFADKQKLAWETVRHAIDESLPCYGWELEIPDFYVIYGYDSKGYFFSGPQCDSGKGPKPWDELGDTGIGILEVYIVKPGEAADDTRTVREAFTFALEHSKGLAKGRGGYKAGLGGFDNWIEALEAGKAGGFGMAYNAAVWSECRGFAVRFLEEAKERLGGRSSQLYNEAKEHYEVVARNLQRVAELFPFPPKGDEIKDPARCKDAVERLTGARRAEEQGLISLEKIVQSL